MSSFQYFLGIFAAILTFGIVIELLRRRKLRERHAGWWLLAGFLALIISVFPSTLAWFAGILGFEAPTNLVFFASFIVLFLVALQHSAELTTLESQDRALVERLVILEQKVAQMENGAVPNK